MTEAAERIFGDSEQAAPLVKQLIYEQATQECRAAIAPKRTKVYKTGSGFVRSLGDLSPMQA